MVSDELSQRCLRFVWTHQPDLAVEAGRLPPVHWEPVTTAERQEALLYADSLLAELDGLTDPVASVCRHHVTCTRSLVARFDIGRLNHMTGPAGRLSWAGEAWPIGDDPTVDFYEQRLAAFPAYCNEIAAAMTGARGSAPVLTAFVAQVDALIDDHHSLARPFTSADRRLPDQVLFGVLDGLARLRRIAAAAQLDGYSASPLPHLADGYERYAETIYAGTSLRLSATDLEDLGHSMLGRSQQRFTELRVSGVGPAFAIGRAHLDRVRETLDRLIDSLPMAFSDLPRAPCEVVVMPTAHAAVGPPAYYGPPSRANGRPGYLYVNTSKPASDWEVLPLVMHEGVPGHHLQMALLDEDESIPDILRLMSVNAFAEGWAVYAETLATALGLSLSPKEELGLIAHQRWRAARLVTDVGLHVRGWSVDEAVDFMTAQTAMDRDSTRREVVRYLAWPGQALGYAVGAETIAGWVTERRAAGVSLAGAHAELLRIGSVPMSDLPTGAGVST